ncbi:DUF2079 domain-containing protein [Kitasatospora sp. NPDC094011]|uniref:DUF2079 domain-containing protein n=1 Tax=Kitasatospora sp. NPDC094011 TaxID=3364090 RepID=UPI003820F305
MSRRSIPYLLAAVLCALYCAVSVTRQLRFETYGFDLGIFEQGVRGYAAAGAPVSTLKGTGFNLLGDHFSPVLALLAPVYRLFPCAVTLLVAQAVLLAVSVVPVTRLAIEVSGRVGGTLLGTAYGLSWGLWAALEFDFHEVAFAVPAAAFAVEALARDRAVAAACWALPLLLVKEDQGLLVAGVGVYLMARRHRRLGAAVVVTAVLVTAVAVLVVIPAHHPDGRYAYADAGEWDGGDPLSRLLLPGTKWWTVLALLAPTAFLALRSPLVLLAVAPLAARFWAVNPLYWGTRYHYSAVLMPVLFLACADGLRRMGPGWVGRLRLAVPSLALVVAVLALPVPPPGPAGLRVTEARQVLTVIPDGARVAAANELAPQLTSRCTVSLFPRLTPPGTSGPWARPVAEWVAILDRRDAWPDDPAPDAAEQRAALAGLPAAGYREAASGGGITVYRWAG